VRRPFGTAPGAVHTSSFISIVLFLQMWSIGRGGGPFVKELNFEVAYIFWVKFAKKNTDLNFTKLNRFPVQSKMKNIFS